MAKPSIRNLVTDLAATLREEVLPNLGAHAGRAHSGEAESGDVTFQIDEHAEMRMEGERRRSPSTRRTRALFRPKAIAPSGCW